MKRKLLAAELAKQGKSVKEIAEIMGVRTHTIYSYLSKCRTASVKEPSPLLGRRTMIMALKRKGLSNAEISKQTGLDRCTVYNEIAAYKRDLERLKFNDLIVAKPIEITEPMPPVEAIKQVYGSRFQFDRHRLTLDGRPTDMRSLIAEVNAHHRASGVPEIYYPGVKPISREAR